MRRIAIALTLLAGCFGEPDTVDKIVGPATTVAPSSEESSSSSEGESSGEESTGEPQVCPDWCAVPEDGSDPCDDVDGEMLCRCLSDARCFYGTHCNIAAGYCE